MWPTDRSRFLDGFACPWKRLLRFHAFGTGIERSSLVYAPIQTGLTLHSSLEQVLKAKATTREEVSNLIDSPIQQYVDKLKDAEFENPFDELRHQVALIQALTHAYTRITMPWLLDKFDIIAVEEGKAIKLPSDFGEIVYRTREDFATRDKTNGRVAIHDFKSSASFRDDDHTEWQDSLQQMLNAYVASLVLGERVDHFYIHVLIKGTRKSPSYLTHPSYRPANLPIVTEDILPHYTPKKGYARVFLPEIPLSIPQWVWSMPADYCAKSVPVVGPYEVNYDKVERFIRGLPKNEQSWFDRLALVSTRWSEWKDPKFQEELDSLFPRTFACYEFGGRRCQFYSICHHHVGWDDPLGTKQFHIREPHHLIGEVEEIE